MTVCANHNETQATAYCRTCGKPLCDTCKRDVRGVIYCEECIAARLAGTMPVNPAVAVVAPPPGLPNPTLAGFLGVIPGVGAFYNGQYQKGIVHVLWIVVLGNLVDMNEAFIPLIPFSIMYMIWDAYKTAKARITGEPVPDPLGINDMFGMSSSGTVGADGTPKPKTGPPIAAIVLIGLGCLFLFGDVSRYIVNRGWPVVFIVIGVWKFAQRWQVE